MYLISIDLLVDMLLFWTNNLRVDVNRAISIVLVTALFIGYFIFWVYYFLVKDNPKTWSDVNIVDKGLCSFFVGIFPFLTVMFFVIDTMLLTNLFVDTELNCPILYIGVGYFLLVLYSFIRLHRLNKSFASTTKILMLDYLCALGLLIPIGLFFLSLNSISDRTISWINTYSPEKFSLTNDTITIGFAIGMFCIVFYLTIRHFKRSLVQKH